MAEWSALGFLRKVRSMQMEKVSQIPRYSSEELHHIYHEIYQAAYKKFCTAAHWVEFYRDIFGVCGLLRKRLPLVKLWYYDFQKTQEYIEIQRMLAHLQEASLPILDEETKVITVRLPKSLHDALYREAKDHQMSLNKYCICKLLQLLDHRVFFEIFKEKCPENKEEGEEVPDPKN